MLLKPPCDEQDYIPQEIIQSKASVVPRLRNTGAVIINIAFENSAFF